MSDDEKLVPKIRFKGYSDLPADRQALGNCLYIWSLLSPKKRR